MRKSYLLGGLAAAVAASLAIPASAITPDETFIGLGYVVVPGNPLVSFGISWVDASINEYFLADRSNASIDAVPMQVNPPVFQIKPTGTKAFAGDVLCPDGTANVCAGPNGVITLNNGTPGSTLELWVGDGPTHNAACPTSMPICSTVKVFAGNAALLTHTIATGGAFRADELCFAPQSLTGASSGLVMIANDDVPPFISFIATDGPNAYKVVKKISFPVATNGIEQCQYDPQVNKFFLNVPEVNGPGDDTQPGAVYVFSPVTMSQVNTFPVDIDRCAGPQGMAIGPRPGFDILLGCNAPSIPSELQNSVIINDMTGGIVAPLSDQGGADEVWFDAIAGQHYFLALGSLLPAEELSIVDAVARQLDQDIFVGLPGGTTRRSHSVAAWSGSPLGLGNSVTAAILPVSATGGTPLPPFSSTLCGGAAAQGCIAFFGAIPIPADVIENTE